MKLKLIQLLIVFIVTNNSHASIVYIEDFTTTSSLPTPTQAYLGSFNTTQLATSGQISVSATSSIASNQLEVSPTSNTRGIGIPIISADMDGAGDYSFSFDLNSLTNPSSGTNAAKVSIWSGSGYTVNTNDYLVLNAETFTLNSNGAATSQQILSQTFNTTGTQTVNFQYDGTSDIVIYLGAETSSFPFPVATFDNLVLESVPEPSSSFLIILAAFTSILRRKR